MKSGVAVPSGLRFSGMGEFMIRTNRMQRRSLINSTEKFFYVKFSPLPLTRGQKFCFYHLKMRLKTRMFENEMVSY